jgi:hypothetical protein
MVKDATRIPYIIMDGLITLDGWMNEWDGAVSVQIVLNVTEH